jgi:hypothetical protein
MKSPVRAVNLVFKYAHSSGDVNNTLLTMH